jgi:hypothetical protein
MTYKIDESGEKIELLHNVGFYSICTQNLRAIVDATYVHNKFFKLDCSSQWSFYKNNDEDVYPKFFKTTDDEFDIEGYEVFTFSDKEEQFSDYKQLNYNCLNKFVKKYFSLSDEVSQIEEELVKKYNINFDETIAVLYRGNDKCKETYIPTYEEMDKKMYDLKQKYPNHRILLQSDEKEFCNHFTFFGGSFVIDEVEKMDRDPTKPIQHVIPHEIRVVSAQRFLAVMSIISKCKTVILNSGNVGMWVCLLRGNSEGVHQYLHPKMWDNYYWIDNG